MSPIEDHPDGRFVILGAADTFQFTAYMSREGTEYLEGGSRRRRLAQTAFSLVCEFQMVKEIHRHGDPLWRLLQVPHKTGPPGFSRFVQNGGLKLCHDKYSFQIILMA